MAGTLLRLLVIFILGFSQLMLFFKAVSITRIKSESLLHYEPKVDDQLSETTILVQEIGAENEETKIYGRMMVELHDYPGAGANNRHTPRPQFERCVNC